MNITFFKLVIFLHVFGNKRMKEVTGGDTSVT